MEAMVVRIETLGQGPFEKYGPCHYRDMQPGSREEGTGLRAAFFQGPAVSGLKDGPSKTCPSPRTLCLDGSSDYDRGPLAAIPPTPLMESMSFSPASCPLDTLRSSTSLPLSKNSVPPSRLSPPPFSFTRIPPATEESFSFPGNCSTALPATLKRRRPVTDVDGPNTASLGCKKRRLRRRLITSKLSQPFSLPATHVLNREAAATGDKRFLKLAAISAARRLSNAASAPSQQQQQQHHPNPSSLLRRAAMINRFRLRVRNEAVERGHADVADVAANAALLQQSHGLGLVVGTRFPVTSQAPPVTLATQALRVGPGNHPHLSMTAVATRPPPLGLAHVAAVEPGGSNPRPPPPPRLDANSHPELGPAADIEENVHDDNDDEEYEIDDGETAFPNSEHDSRYDSSDEPDDVYADFELIFCGGAGDAESPDDDGEHYEDVMDDLDGIPWTVR